MKNIKKTLLLLSLSAVSANAAVTLGGAAITNAKLSDGTTNISTGSLVLLIVDTGSNGFFNLGSPTGNTTFSSTSNPSLTSLQANLSTGSTFGGEYILNRISSGSGSVSSILTNVNISSYLNKQFALVWFEGLTAAGSELTAAAGTKWGISRGSDWVFPSADSGTFTSSSSDAGGASSFYQVNQLTPAANSAAFRSVVGTTGSAAFTIVPEPSAALLGAIGALVLLRRRRN